MKDLKVIRRRIDQLDDRLLRLLDERAREVQAVYHVKVNSTKKGEKVQVVIPERESSIIKRLKKKKLAAFPGEGVEAVFREVISASRSLEATPAIAYFGQEGSNTHAAAKNQFGSLTVYEPQTSIKAVFEAVQAGEADYGVVPVENSTEGDINLTLDLLAESDLEICSEIRLQIRHYLLNRSGSLNGIKRVLSHPQALAQCRAWLEKNLPGAAQTVALSTSDAARSAAKDKKGGTAAIASKLALELYGLKAAAKNIQDKNDNETRFFVIGKNAPKHTGNDKTSIVLNIRDRVGALAQVIDIFSRRKINLTAIKSRPSGLKAWDYYFFIDFEGHKDEPKIKALLQLVEAKVKRLKVLGSYPAA